MSRPEQDALETNFAKWRLDRAPALPADKAFERYCAEQVLKDYELSDSEISYGECGATNDGGVDGLYFFAGRRLITDTVDIPEAATTATLEIIQATYESGGFREIRIERFEAFAKDLLDYDTPPSQITHLNPRAQDLIENFRTKYQMMLGTPHELKVVFHYAMRTVVDPNKNTKLASRFKRVQRIVRNSLSNANVSLEYWGSSRLLTRVREQPDQMLKLAVTKHFLTQNGDVVCLAKLADYFKFITKGGDIRASMFEPNVRDYQGRRNDVNKDIRTTLETVTADEFWWLNNGVTILARECPISGNTLTITNPEVVNGLQTSYEICQFFRDHPANLATDTRSLVLRVIIPPNEQVSSKIIKATNFQTEVKGMSLHATEQIHFDIEDKLGLIGLWYDRKKGKYKRLRKPISDIISVVDLARSVIAILLMRPDDARARPQSLLADDKTYLEIFSRAYDCAVYVFCIRLDRRITTFLESSHKYTIEEQRDIRYYLDLWVACTLVNSAQPTAAALAAAIQNLDTISDDEIAKYAMKILKSYRAMGGEQIAKSQRFSMAIKKRIRREFLAAGTP